MCTYVYHLHAGCLEIKRSNHLALELQVVCEPHMARAAEGWGVPLFLLVMVTCPLILALCRQRYICLWVRGHPGLYSELQANQSCHIVRPPPPTFWVSLSPFFLFLGDRRYNGSASQPVTRDPFVGRTPYQVVMIHN